MALATVEDVRRVLRIPETSVDAERDEQFSFALEAAISWVNSRLVQKYDDNTGGTYTAYDIRETDSVLLPRVGATVNEVRVTLGSETYFTLGDTHILSPDQYDVIEGPRGAYEVRLRPVLAFAPFEGASAERLPRTYRTVEIDWEPPADELVPAAIRDATALIAAGMWTQGPRLAAGYTSEKIGDYSYRLEGPRGGSQEGSDYWGQAERLLRPFTRRKPMVT